MRGRSGQGVPVRVGLGFSNHGVGVGIFRNQTRTIPFCFGTRTSGWEVRDNAGSLMALSHTPQPLGNGHPTSSRQHEIEIW